MKKSSKKYIYGCLTIFCMAVIFVLSAQNGYKSSDMSEGFLETILGEFLGRVLPSITSEGVYKDIRKYAHIFEYFCLGVTSCLYFSEIIIGYIKACSLDALFCFLYACSDEWHQTFVPGRDGNFVDVLIDSAGAVIGISLTLALLLIKASAKKGGRN